MTPTRRPRCPGRRAGRGRSCAVILYKCARVLMLKETAISVNESLPFAKPTYAVPAVPARGAAISRQDIASGTWESLVLSRYESHK